MPQASLCLWQERLAFAKETLQFNAFNLHTHTHTHTLYKSAFKRREKMGTDQEQPQSCLRLAGQALLPLRGL